MEGASEPSPDVDLPAEEGQKDSPQDLERQDQQATHGESLKSPRSGSTPLPPKTEPTAPPMPEDASEEILEQEDPLPTLKSPRSPRGEPQKEQPMESDDIAMTPMTSSKKALVNNMARSATVKGAAFAIHWFGARRFDYEDNEAHRARNTDLRRQSVRTKDLVRDLMREDFKKKRKSKSSMNVAKANSCRSNSSLQEDPASETRTSAGPAPRAGAGAAGGRVGNSTTTTGTKETRTTIDTIFHDAENALEGGNDLLFEAQTSGMFVEEELTTQNRPWFVLLQVLLCLGLWIVYTFVDGRSLAGLESIFRRRTLALVHGDCRDHRPEVWRLWTYQFTHTAVAHVLTNSLIACVAGMPLEGFHGHLRTAGIFNVGVVAGALSHMVVMAHSAALAGMSAGCYALLGMHWGDLMMNWRQSKFRRGKLLLLVFLIMIDIFSNSVLAPAPKPGMPEVSHSSHLGGFLAGLLAGILFCRNLKVTKGERIVQAVAVFLCLIGLIFLGSWLSQWPPKGLFDSKGWCWLRQANNRTVFGDLNWHCVRCADDTCIQGWAGEASMNRVAPADCGQLGIWE